MSLNEIQYTLAETIPHAPGFTLLDQIVSYGENHAVCSLRIHPGSLFFQPGRGVPSWVAIEYMAQTIAVYGGITRLRQQKPVQIALLLGTQSMKCHCDYFTEGQELTLHIESQLLSAVGVGLFSCETRDGSTVLARADIKAYQPDDITPYLEQLRAYA